MWKKEKIEHSTEGSVGNVTGNTFIGDVGNIIAGAGNAVTVHENSMEEGVIQQISDAEWAELAKFFIDKQFSSNVVDQEYKEQYAMAEELTKKKDRNRLKNFLKGAGESFLKIVLGAGVQAGVRGIINKVME